MQSAPDNSESIACQREESYQRRLEDLRQRMIDDYTASSRAGANQSRGRSAAARNAAQRSVTTPLAAAQGGINQEFLGV